MAKTILITGAGRGFGHIWAQAFLERGDNVVATARNPAALQALAAAYPDTLLALPLDVTDRLASQAVVAQAQQRFGTLDVLINNAGYGQMGAVEEVSEEAARRQVETNILGQLWLIQAVLPIMRQQQHGHIVQVSSALGLVAVPTLGLYSASKWAVEGLVESLAAEVSGFGIHVTLVEPNGYATDFGGSSIVSSAPLAAYNPMREAFYATNNPDDLGIPAATAPAILTLIDAATPPLRLFLGKIGLPWVKHTYENRLATWEQWQSVSVAAHGK